jgi:hypothetical protein
MNHQSIVLAASPTPALCASWGRGCKRRCPTRPVVDLTPDTRNGRDKAKQPPQDPRRAAMEHREGGSIGDGVGKPPSPRPSLSRHGASGRRARRRRCREGASEVSSSIWDVHIQVWELQLRHPYISALTGRISTSMPLR